MSDIKSVSYTHLTLPTSREPCVDLGGRRSSKKKTKNKNQNKKKNKTKKKKKNKKKKKIKT